MCGTQGNDCCCCPDAVIFKEEICGNIGPTTSAGEVVWQPIGVNDYIQGTFEVFNAGPGDIIFAVVNGGPNFTVPVGTTQVISVNNPTVLGIISNGATGKWCITLYKRVFA